MLYFFKNKKTLSTLLSVLLVCQLLSSNAMAQSTSKGFQVVTDEHGKYWFVDPKGDRFLSLGVNNIIAKPFRPRPGTDYYDPVPNQFDSYEAWKQDVHAILKKHGFNTIGSWSDGQLYDVPLYGTICLYVAGHAADRCLDALRPGFEDRVRSNVKLMLDRYPHRDNVFGVFLDNEMPWYGHGAWGDVANNTLLELAISLSDDDLAKKAALDFLKQRYESADALSEAWGKPLSSWDKLTFEYARSCLSVRANEDRQEFIALAAEAFYSTACETVRQMLPGKLILGTRYAAYAPESVIRACGRHCDVISFNDYRPEPVADTEMLARYWIWGGRKPLMITEYAWRAEENTSGNPNSGGAGAVVKTQAQRAENYRKYVEDLLSYPMVLGAHWFEFSDQSPQGRFDGENSNYGIVDIHHRPYTELLSAMKMTNLKVADIHAQSTRPVPKSLPKPKAVVFEPSQRPDRPALVDLLADPILGPQVFAADDASLKMQAEDNYLHVVMDTGTQWGCGISFFGPKKFKNPAGPQNTTNLDGYSEIILDAKVSKGLFFDFFIDEAGVDAPGSISYDLSAGDDAESFMIPANQGTGQRYQYRFALKDLQVRTEWGNQKGARRVDIHAVKGAAIYFSGGQGKASVKIYSFKLVR